MVLKWFRKVDPRPKFWATFMGIGSPTGNLPWEGTGGAKHSLPDFHCQTDLFAGAGLGITVDPKTAGLGLVNPPIFRKRPGNTRAPRELANPKARPRAVAPFLHPSGSRPPRQYRPCLLVVPPATPVGKPGAVGKKPRPPGLEPGPSGCPGPALPTRPPDTGRRGIPRPPTREAHLPPPGQRGLTLAPTNPGVRGGNRKGRGADAPGTGPTGGPAALLRGFAPTHHNPHLPKRKRGPILVSRE